MDFPVKQGKIKQRNRYFNYLVITHADKILIRLRGAKDIWQGLHDFPMLESNKPIATGKFLKNKIWEEIISITKPIVEDVSEEYVHILSHQKLYARFYAISNGGKIADTPPACFWVKIKDLKKYAVPKLIDLYIRKKIVK